MKLKSARAFFILTAVLIVASGAFASEAKEFSSLNTNALSSTENKSNLTNTDSILFDGSARIASIQVYSNTGTYSSSTKKSSSQRFSIIHFLVSSDNHILNDSSIQYYSYTTRRNLKNKYIEVLTNLQTVK